MHLLAVSKKRFPLPFENQGGAGGGEEDPTLTESWKQGKRQLTRSRDRAGCAQAEQTVSPAGSSGRGSAWVTARPCQLERGRGRGETQPPCDRPGTATAATCGPGTGPAPPSGGRGPWGSSAQPAAGPQAGRTRTSHPCSAMNLPHQNADCKVRFGVESWGPVFSKVLFNMKPQLFDALNMIVLK